MIKKRIECCLTIAPPRGRLRDAAGTWHWSSFGCTADYWISAADSELRVAFHEGTRSMQPFPLSSTTPYYGGIRWWFVCPKCGRRVAKLHTPSVTDCFLCRCCHALTYESAQSSGTKAWKNFQTLGRKSQIATREVVRWLRLEDDLSEVHEVKRPAVNKIRDRRTGFALLVTKKARSKGLSL
jgi:hypothetical protein